MSESWPGRIGRAITGLFVPATCASCGGGVSRARVGQLCLRCVGQIDRAHRPWCALCGLPVKAAPVGPNADGCQRACGPRGFDVARSYGLQEGVLRDLVTRLKYGGEQALGEPLGQLVLEAAQDHFTVQEYEAIVPIPLHASRQRERGFNQAFLLARPLAREARIPIVHALQRSAAATPQVGQPSAARSANMQGAFALNPRSKEKVGKRNVLLVDDVMTTGATVHEAARALKRAGATRVDVVTLARAT